ncbi:hypothetical protein B0J15DRAFT_482409, partial [Fusarium solani]
MLVGLKKVGALLLTVAKLAPLKGIPKPATVTSLPLPVSVPVFPRFHSSSLEGGCRNGQRHLACDKSDWRMTKCAAAIEATPPARDMKMSKYFPIRQRRQDGTLDQREKDKA